MSEVHEPERDPLDALGQVVDAYLEPVDCERVGGESPWVC